MIENKKLRESAVAYKLKGNTYVETAKVSGVVGSTVYT